MSHRDFRFLIPLAALFGTSLETRVEAQGPPPALDITLHPVCAGGPEVTGIEVRAELRGASYDGDKRFSVQAAITYPGVPGIADRIEKIVVRDDSGNVPLARQDDPARPGGFPYFRHWRAERATVGPVVLTYRSVPQSTPPVNGPQFSFRAHHGGLSTAGSGFLGLPEGLDVAVMRVKWDLSGLAPASIAASTFGEGDFSVTGPPMLLTQGFFMAGPLGRYSIDNRPDTFVAYWLGTPSFEPQKEMAWAAESYAYQQNFFLGENRSAYRVFIRALPGFGTNVGGTALLNSFTIAVETGKGDPSVKSPRQGITHEMLHMFTGDIKGDDAGPWFQEGLTDFYTYRLLLRSGLDSVDSYLKSVNDAATNYYSNPYRNASAAELSQLGFDKGVGAISPQRVPYLRGRLYFATVDAKIRAASKGKRNLDDVIVPLFKKRAAGERFDVPTLVAAFEHEYGPDARTDFHSVNVLGETVNPPSEAFGVGFQRRSKIFNVQGKDVQGYEWIRIPSVSEERIRQR
jgi:hypothetical protein